MCDLQRFLKDLKEAILNFRLDLCCFVFSVRAGILLCGYFNMILNMISLIAVSTGVLPPLMMNAQQSFMEGEYIPSTCAFAYSADLCLAVLLLCAMYRKDIILLTYYTYCGLAMLASTVLVYSMVIGILSVLHTCMLLISLTYQVYIILLVRSVIVELKHEAEKLEYFYQNYPYWNHDIEAFGDYPLETYEIYSPASSRKNSAVIQAVLNLPKATENEPVGGTVELTTKEVKDDSEPKKSEVKDTVESKSSKVKDASEPMTSKSVEEVQPPSSKRVDTKQSTDDKSKTDTLRETAEKSKRMRYPYKFIAIKVPKNEPIQEEKENEDKENETKIEAKKETKKVAKEAKVKEETKEIDKEAKVKEETNKVGKEAKVTEETKEVAKEAKVTEETKEVAKEAKVTEETKEVAKEAKVKEQTKEIAKKAKKPKQSIFGRKKSKSDSDKTKDEEKNN